jgi:hypothetical protein
MTTIDQNPQPIHRASIKAQIVHWADEHRFKWRAALAQDVEEIEVELVSEHDNRLDLVWFKLLADGRINVDFMAGGCGAQKSWIEESSALLDMFKRVQKESDGWAAFMAAGPGKGH